MHGRQVAVYVGCLSVLVACVSVGYDALFPSPSAAPHGSRGRSDEHCRAFATRSLQGDDTVLWCRYAERRLRP
jgi:hypothetical protein